MFRFIREADTFTSDPQTENRKIDRGIIQDNQALRQLPGPSSCPVLQATPRSWRRRNRLRPKIGNHRDRRDFLRTRDDRGAKIWRRNSDEHEIRIPPRPAQRLLFGFEKTIDNDCASFEWGAANAARGFAADHGRSGIHREQSRVGQRYPTAVRNAARIDGAMAGLQARARGTDVTPRPAIRTAATAGPIDCDAREDGLLAGRDRGRE